MPDLFLPQTPSVEIRSASGTDFVHTPLGYDGIIGRAEDADIRLSDAEVSRYHARLVHDSQGLFITDLDSSNGTRVGDRRLSGSWQLQDGEIVRLGDSQLVIHMNEQPNAAPDAASTPFGALIPEPPLGAAVPVAHVTDTPDGAPNYGGGIHGTVLRVDYPQVNVKPNLVIDLRTDTGVTVAIRARFWLPFGVPHVAEGHQLLVEGRQTMAGFVEPRRIVNETLGVEWRRRNFLGFGTVDAVVIGLILLIFLLILVSFFS
jgi:hypothetical protein